jgi:sulfate adenylyltransferase subunit 1
MEQQAAERLVMNDIARVSFKLAQPIFADPYAESRGTGAFIVIDESSNNTVGAGMIV